MRVTVIKNIAKSRVKWIVLSGFVTLGSCVQPPSERPQEPGTPARVVTYYNDVPQNCSEIKGLKQTVVRRVTSEKELIRHYGMTFRVRFQDKVTPELYGALYYQDAKENKYCMALPDGRFAVFHDSQLAEHTMNAAQEVCYPIMACN